MKSLSRINESCIILLVLVGKLDRLLCDIFFFREVRDWNFYMV